MSILSDEETSKQKTDLENLPSQEKILADLRRLYTYLQKGGKCSLEEFNRVIEPTIAHLEQHLAP